MHLLYIWLLTLFLIYLIVVLMKTPLIHLLNIIIIIFFINHLDIAYYVTLKRLLTARQSSDCNSFSSLLF